MLNYQFCLNYIDKNYFLQYIGFNLFIKQIKMLEKRFDWSTSPIYNTIIPQIMKSQKYKLINFAFHLVKES